MTVSELETILRKYPFDAEVTVVLNGTHKYFPAEEDIDLDTNLNDLIISVGEESW